MIYAGVELGGTKCVAILARGPDDLLARETIPTTTPEETLDRIEGTLLDWKREHDVEALRLFRGFPYQGPLRGSFTVLDAEIQMFQYLLDKDLVLASGLAGGVIFGRAPYLSQFRLGGTDRLRGFFYDRFRGSKYYVQQNELRFPVLGLVGGATFLEFGEVTEKHFSRAHVSYGVGLRIGIPPDKVAQMRIDYAMSADQKGVFVDFGHAF